MRLRLTDIRNNAVQELDLSPETCDMPGWQSGVAGWSIGPKGSGAPIELDQPLGDCRVGVFSFSFQLLLWGMAKELPDIWLIPQGAERWLLVDREDLRLVAMGGDVRLRIDQSPIRFGNYIIESLKAAATAETCCEICSEPLRLYFRVGSQQLCPACTETFKQESRASLEKCYRHALLNGIVAAIVGGLIHGVLLAAAHVSFGSILIGVLVGLAMRIASKETAGFRHRLTAVILTFIAGSQPWWRSLSNGTTTSAFYLAIAMIAAWTVTARNIPTAIHGPFQEIRGRG